MLDDHWRKAMSLEGYRSHLPTVATPNRPDQTLNVSMPRNKLSARDGVTITHFSRTTKTRVRDFCDMSIPLAAPDRSQ